MPPSPSARRPTTPRADVPAARHPRGPGARRFPGRMDLAALEHLLQTDTIGTLVLTAGTTALGAVDPIDEALSLRERTGAAPRRRRLRRLLHHPRMEGSGGIPAAPFRAIALCDSVVVDPHKHGLQPYGCGCVLFRDPSVGRFYVHDSPYTYFSSSELHLGEISLECSVPGPPPRHCGRPSNSSLSPRTGWARSWGPAAGPRSAFPD